MPKLKHPDGGTIEVSPSQVDNYELAGWEKQSEADKK